MGNTKDGVGDDLTMLMQSLFNSVLSCRTQREMPERVIIPLIIWLSTPPFQKDFVRLLSNSEDPNVNYIFFLEKAVKGIGMQKC